MTGPLMDTVCVVAGASRGVGRGIAVGLGEAGGRVVVSGRSTRFGARTDGRRETIEDSAELVEAAGGAGYPYVCDHTDRRALHDLSAHVLRRHGAPDVLVSAVWGGNEGFDGERHADGSGWGTPFWERGLDPVEHALKTGPLAALATVRAFAGPMIAKGGGLVVLVGFDAGGAYLGDVVYDLAKAATLRIMRITAAELGPRGVTVVHLSPGFVHTERVNDVGHGTMATETPAFSGRAVAALAQDPNVGRHHGQSLHTADLARHYGFVDLDGTQPERFDPAAEHIAEAGR